MDFRPLASAKLDDIDECLIDRYVQERRKKVSPATVNRQLATLRRLLRLAYDWKVIDRVPRVRLLPGESTRDLVLARAHEPDYLSAVPQPLHDVAVLILDTGLRVGEALALRWSDIHIDVASATRHGYLQVRNGKSRNARRTVSITKRVRDILLKRKAESDPLRMGLCRSIWIALRWDISEPPASAGTSQTQTPEGLRNSFATAYDADEVGGSRSGCVHDYADCWSQQHHGVSAIRSPLIRVGRTGD